MTLRVEIPADVEHGLLTQARAKGLSLEAYVQELLRERLHAEREPQPADKRPARRESLVDAFAPLRGLELDFGRNPSTGRRVDL